MEYDFRRCESKLSVLPNSITEIDVLSIHVRSEYETVYRLKEIPRAHADIQANRVAGKVVGVIT